MAGGPGRSAAQDGVGAGVVEGPLRARIVSERHYFDGFALRRRQLSIVGQRPHAPKWAGSNILVMDGVWGQLDVAGVSS